MAQRIREDLQISENEVDSPEREMLRSQIFPEKSPPPSPPCVKGFPSPAPLVFTPSKTQEDTEIPAGNVKYVKCSNCERLMTPDHQCGETTPVFSSATVHPVSCLASAPSGDVKSVLLKTDSDIPSNTPPLPRRGLNINKFCVKCDKRHPVWQKCQCQLESPT